MQLFGFLFLLLLFCIYCPLKFQHPLVIGLGKKAESLIKQTIKPSLADWFTNLDGKGERGAMEMFLHHVSNPLCRAE